MPQSLAQAVRELSTLVDHLPDQIKAAYTTSSPEKRSAEVSDRTTRITVGMSSLIGWIERRRPADTAELEKRRVFQLQEAAHSCAQIFARYGTGEIASTWDKNDVKALGSFRAYCCFFAAGIDGWAGEIERENGPVEPAEKSVTPGADGWRALFTIAAIVGLALGGFYVLDSFKAALWLMFLVLSAPVLLSFTRSKPMSEKGLKEIYSAGLKQIPAIVDWFKSLGPSVPHANAKPDERNESADRLEQAKAAILQVVAVFPVDATRKQADGWRDRASTVLRSWFKEEWYAEFIRDYNFAGNEIVGTRRVIEQGKTWLIEKTKAATERDLRA